MVMKVHVYCIDGCSVYDYDPENTDDMERFENLVEFLTACQTDYTVEWVK